LASRLEQHQRRCLGRCKINVADMSFRCLYIDRFVDAASPERVLIANYRALGLAPWNGDVGFAPKDVGRNRDKTRPGMGRAGWLMTWRPLPSTAAQVRKTGIRKRVS